MMIVSHKERSRVGLTVGWVDGPTLPPSADPIHGSMLPHPRGLGLDHSSLELQASPRRYGAITFTAKHGRAHRSLPCPAPSPPGSPSFVSFVFLVPFAHFLFRAPCSPEHPVCGPRADQEWDDMKNCFWLKSMNVEMAKVGCSPTGYRSILSPGRACRQQAHLTIAPRIASADLACVVVGGVYQIEQAKLDAARAEALLEAEEAGVLAAKTGSARGTVWPARKHMPAGWDQPGTVVPAFDEDEIAEGVPDRRYGGCS